jgi:hypothetical protein
MTARRTPAKPQEATQAQQPEPCPHCKEGGETFRCFGNLYKWNVDRAREIVSDGRQPIELEPDDVEFSVDGCRIYPQHVDHVNPAYPGIIAHYWFPDPSGEVLHGHMLIDGHHRAARCLRDHLPYYVHVLSEEESREIVIHAPEVAPRTGVEAHAAEARQDTPLMAV